MRESAFYVCENKDPDQLSGSRTADQRLSFLYIVNTNIRNYKPQAIFYVCTARSVWVLVGNLEHRFSRDAAQKCLLLYCGSLRKHVHVIYCHIQRLLKRTFSDELL